MKTEEKQLREKVGEMHKQRQTMADGKRYIIFYTFGNENKNAAPVSDENEVKNNV